MNTLTDEQLQLISATALAKATESFDLDEWQERTQFFQTFTRTVIDLALSKMAEGEGKLVYYEELVDDALPSVDTINKRHKQAMAALRAQMQHKIDWNVQQVQVLHEGLHQAKRECEALRQELAALKQPPADREAFEKWAKANKFPLSPYTYSVWQGYQDALAHKPQPEPSVREAQLLACLEKARCLIVKHHDASFRCESGMFCPVCSPDGKDVPFNEAFAVLWGDVSPLQPWIPCSEELEVLAECQRVLLLFSQHQNVRTETVEVPFSLDGPETRTIYTPSDDAKAAMALARKIRDKFGIDTTKPLPTAPTAEKPNLFRPLEEKLGRSIPVAHRVEKVPTPPEPSTDQLFLQQLDASPVLAAIWDGLYDDQRNDALAKWERINRK